MTGTPATQQLSWDDLRRWDPSAVEDGATTLKRATDTLESLQDELDHARPEEWTGISADAAAQTRRRLLLDLETTIAETAKTRAALYQAADEVTDIADQVAEIERWASAAGLSIAADGTVTDARPFAVSGGTIGTLVTNEYVDAKAARERLVKQCLALVQDVLDKAVSVDQELSSTLASVLSGQLRVTKDVGLAAADRIGTDSWLAAHQPPPPGSSAAANSRWWKNLSPEAQQSIITNHPDWIGNRNGVDFTSRDKANRNLLPVYARQQQHNLDSLNQQLAALGPEPPAGTPEHDTWVSNRSKIQSKIQIVTDKLASLATVQSILAKGDRQLLFLGVDRPRAEAVIAVGNVDTATHIGVFTPGLTSTVQGMEGDDGHMFDLKDLSQDTLARYGDNSSVAMVQWLGYQAPQLTPESLKGGDTVLSPFAAIDGGVRLAGFLQGIQASRAGDVQPPQVTALGHSYGSTTTAYALVHDTGVARAMFFGSPGIVVPDANVFQVPQGHVYYQDAIGDYIAPLGTFGGVASLTPHLNHLSTADATAADGHALIGIEPGYQVPASEYYKVAHTSYLNNGTTSQYNVAALVAGHPELTIADPLAWTYGPRHLTGQIVPVPVVNAPLSPVTYPGVNAPVPAPSNTDTTAPHSQAPSS